MCLQHMVIISIFSHGFLIESSTNHLLVHLPLPYSCQQVLFKTICPDSFTNDILHRKSHE